MGGVKISALIIFLLPFAIGLGIGIALRSWSALAVVAGIPLAIPPTAFIIPTLVSARADSVWYWSLPVFGVGLFCGGLIGVLKHIARSIKARSD